MLAVTLMLMSGCMVGPNYVRPAAQVEHQWLETDDPRLSPEPEDHREWWTVFNDPILTSLVEAAYAQNLTLQIAGLLILQARAQLGIAAGDQYPQTQVGAGSFSRTYTRQNANSSLPNSDSTNSWQFGFDTSWELDLWGRFRRGIEAANADLQASLANYDDVLVSLTAEVASTYVQIRTLERRLVLTRQNVTLQEESLRIARARLNAGDTTQLDVEESLAQLTETQSQIPGLETSLRQAQNALSILLGTPPRDLREILGGPGPIPTAPAQVMVGIPAELLRRRPDIQRAEQEAAAQSASIGIAVADFYPQFSLNGSLSVEAKNFTDLWKSSFVVGIINPSFSWPLFNYGRIRNNVRLQDASFQELVVTYQNTVLQAAQEVEDALVAFLKTQEEAKFLAESVAANIRRTKLARLQYREGLVPFISVLIAQTALVDIQNDLATSRGNIVLNLIATYKALGGGWQIRLGQDVIPKKTREVMRARTNWGKLLTPEAMEPKPVRLFTPIDW